MTKFQAVLEIPKFPSNFHSDKFVTWRSFFSYLFYLISLTIFSGFWATRFFYKQRFFSTQRQCWLTFSWIELQTLLRCCLIHIIIIILRHVLYLLYLCPCLDLGLFMSYLCDLFFIFIFIFIMINRIISWIQTYLFFCLFFRICPIIFGW